MRSWQSAPRRPAPAGALRARGRAYSRAMAGPAAAPARVVKADAVLSAASALFASDSRPIVLYDGVCNMCNAAVNIALDADPDGRFRFAALQSAVGRVLLVAAGKAPDDISSIVLVQRPGDPAGVHFKSDAVLRIAQGLGGYAYWALGGLGLLAPTPLRDGVYGVVARNRYRFFGHTADACRLGDAGKYAARFVADDRVGAEAVAAVAPTLAPAAAAAAAAAAVARG